MKPKTSFWIALLALFALVAAACGDGGGEGDGDASEAAGGGGGEGEITLMHGITGAAEQEALQAAVDAYQEESGNTVNVEPSPDFSTIIVTRVTGGNAPDVALYPQPGLLRNIAEQGNAVDFEEAGVELEDDQLVPGMVETGTFDDKTYGVVVKLGIKSLLWYAKDDMEADGYEVPDTWTGLKEVTTEIADGLGGEAGRAPWCIGIEDGGNTGWVATDWIEGLVLRIHGEEVYAQWVTNAGKFESPEITEVFEELESIWFDEKAVVGGTTGILQTPFADSVTPMFADPAGCYMHRQAGFIT